MSKKQHPKSHEQEQGNVMFPIFVKLNQLKTLIVGGGYVGLEKLEAVLRNSPDAPITLVGSEILQKDIWKLAKKHPNLKVIEDKYRKKYLKGKDLVICATDSRALHEDIKSTCQKKHLLCNVADTPDLCDFYLSSVVIKGDLKIAISSNGKSPTLTKRIRAFLEDAIPNDKINEILDQLVVVRDQLKGDFEYKVEKLNEATKSFVAEPRKALDKKEKNSKKESKEGSKEEEHAKKSETIKSKKKSDKKSNKKGSLKKKS